MVVNVMKSIKHDSFPFKKVKVLNVVIDHIIGADDAFIAAKNNIAPADEREMLTQPAQLFG